MAILNIVNPRFKHSLFPIVTKSEGRCQPLLSKINGYKKPYMGLNCFLSWGEKICSGNTASFFSSQRKILQKHSSAFALPGWFDKTSRLSHEVSKIIGAKTSAKKVEAVKKTIFASLDFTNASISVVQSINLTEYLGKLPPVLYIVFCVNKFILSTNSLLQNYEKLKGCPTKQVQNELSIQHKMLDSKINAIFNLLRSLAGFFGATISMLSNLLSISFSSYWMLCISTFTFMISMIIDFFAKM